LEDAQMPEPGQSDTSSKSPGDIHQDDYLVHTTLFTAYIVFDEFFEWEQVEDDVENFIGDVVERARRWRRGREGWEHAVSLSQNMARHKSRH
jgi:hypothetical protein